MSSHTNETGDNSQNASSSSPPQKHTQDTTPKKMEKTEKERENKERGRPSSGSPSLTKASPVKVANTDSRHGREEKVRLAREKQEEERRRKIEEFRESNQRAADFRRKQEDERQRKILEARQKELDRRMTVEERRKKLFQEENVSGRGCRGERKQAILRKTAERESKLSQHRSSSRQHAIFGFGSSVPRMSDPLDANKRAISHASLPRRSLNSSGVTDGGVDEDATKAPPRAMSAWSLSRKSTTTAAASCDKPADLSSASAVVSNSIKRTSMKRLSTSTSQLSKKKLSLPDSTLQKHALVGCSIGNISEDTSTTTAPIARRPKSSYSDNTLSSSEWSPMRRPRPHSVGGRLPSYASPTFSSQAHQGRSTEKKADGNQLVCHRFRKLRSKSADPSSARRSRADLRRTFERLSAPKVPSAKDTSASTKATPVRDKPPARSSTRSLSSQRQGSARPSPVTSIANTAAKAKTTPPKMQPAVARTVTPALKPSMPSVSKNSKPTPKGPVKAVHIKVTTSQEKKPAKKVPSPKEVSPVKEKKPPGEDTAKMEDKSKQISEDDYKAKLAEKRRQAREKAERDAEEAKQREEQRM
ncbi:hypothetical protein NP493_497g02029 [Ridgeia piscesae]|uniref:Ensconsin n=1 Tax=Ridgeia piscesae TaxID=27915 RepID=A0AAD9NSP4_RIDPI|nr:hypothetical protein NP493_497g02029 [Ridgeia piscesae]